MKLISILILSSTFLSLPTLTLANQNDPVADARKICHYQAVEKSGYDPKKASSSNTVAKGAGVGAAGGGLKKNRAKKQAVLGESNYKTEYDSCLRSRNNGIRVERSRL